jgi:hypothetical protein
MNRFILTVTGGLFLAAALAMPTVGETPTQRGPANPGTINYIEGQASIGNRPIAENQAGTAMLQANQTLTTDSGKVEVLLTPGVFARVGDDSSVEMISPNLTRTELAVRRGNAMVEVAEILPQNDLLFDEDGATVKLQKTGLYDFDAADGQFRVFNGQATVQDGDEHAKVKGGHEVSFSSPKLKSENFNKKQFESSDLYKWSSLRSAYLAEANVNEAPVYLDGGLGGWYGPGWMGADWYWDPWFDCYTFVPGDGIFYSPFGWGFYPPYLAYEAPIYFGGHFPHRFDPYASQWGPGRHYVPTIRGGGFGNGFHPTTGLHGTMTPRNTLGSGAFRGMPPAGSFHGPVGGFRGAAGGFHGGGFRGGGGFHGGR